MYVHIVLDCSEQIFYAENLWIYFESVQLHTKTPELFDRATALSELVLVE